MPELPEVETMRRGLLPVVGATIEEAALPPCRLRPISWRPTFAEFRRRVRGRRIVEVGRRGKRVLLQLCDDSLIVIEPRMTGLVLLADPPGEEHLRLRLRLIPEGGGEGPRELLFWDRRGLGTIRLLAAEEIEGVLGSARLGPDALAIDAAMLRERLGGSRRAIKVALLDQRAAAGIGNLYAAEILFTAGVDPRARCDRLTGAQWERIAAATHAILNDAILHEGSTLSDGTYRNALNDPGSYQNHHRVYDRAGERCRRCEAATIERIVQAQRATFFCPGCQTRRGRHRSVP
ncbi:bifunctional DNA-formamidopyrimidine glycosylase/DNA-(apurinic or apyrimidinic site) lyase [Candidatus Laterigemmans baculatus]|uniref:bifunctional DNA-formamidopyrimidine glycosylase/DNA-(apurinic or apyrimidinic site) lyase n=1 Tax=Candidatus Laterigemmans baculatus TaxID=2770505 RepID=UPI0013DD352C|nr:bifunctional DNA-formamidopyrimidine glycosylase/DNA-(apurinic or apyrimidinic site) lyase [Candidatus Laterigemmans baculatus]